jgi:hypothetical protein
MVEDESSASESNMDELWRALLDRLEWSGLIDTFQQSTAENLTLDEKFELPPERTHFDLRTVVSITGRLEQIYFNTRNYRNGALNVSQVRNLELRRAVAATAAGARGGFWLRIKREFDLLVCTKHKSYARVRRQLAAHANTAQTAIIGLITAAISSRLGVAAGVITPFIALFLLLLLSLGRNAYCY